ncbi:hypothetical protein CERSUDRAFT_117164 [Gelatoporia subvermispora B]|uniref:Kinase n=1 Tax=Ceriporiopsis subvermispora (strain B) TaxID=914234 RepID=M2QBA9_CERS8|nr:hypothetical protein CERSUDRAFT_117164 [Gelatoporia subvermispora B]
MTSTPPIAHQVAGHAGFLNQVEDSDGSLLVKFAHIKEVLFYQTIVADDALAPLRPIVPAFLGTLKLEGQLAETGDTGEPARITPVEGIPQREFIVLENLTYRFDKPNVLDVKLGTILYDEDATPEKRARMEAAARATTSGETGMRLTGFQVYDLAATKPIITTKEYSKLLKSAELPQGVARFFPLTTDTVPPEPSQTAASQVTASQTTTSSTVGTSGTGLPADILLPILQNIREDVEEIRDRVAEVHVRMRSASLLVIYEADWERAREGLRLLEEAISKGEQPEDEDYEEDENEDEASGDEDEQRPPLPYTVKLIDFAHSTPVPGQGPDEGVLKGLATFMELLDGRIEQVQKHMPT